MIILNSLITNQLNFLFPEKEFNKNKKDEIIKILNDETKKFRSLVLLFFLLFRKIFIKD